MDPPPISGFLYVSHPSSGRSVPSKTPSTRSMRPSAPLPTISSSRAHTGW